MTFLQWCNKEGVRYIQDLDNLNSHTISPSYGFKFQTDRMEELNNLEDFEIAHVDKVGTIYMRSKVLKKGLHMCNSREVKEVLDSLEEVEYVKVTAETWQELENTLNQCLVEIAISWQQREPPYLLADLGILVAARKLRQTLCKYWKGVKQQPEEVHKLGGVEKTLLDRIAGNM